MTQPAIGSDSLAINPDAEQAKAETPAILPINTSISRLDKMRFSIVLILLVGVRGIIY
jgi:hypothetical protein